MSRKSKMILSFLRSYIKDKIALHRASAYRYFLEKEYPAALFEPGCIVSGKCSFGLDVHIGTRTTIVSSSIDGYTYLGNDCYFYQTKIGKFCSLGSQILAGLGRHPTNYVSTYPAFYSTNNAGARISIVKTQLFKEQLPIEIGSDVWIGARAILLDGITIGHGAIVAAGAVVTHNIEPYSVVGGVPARLIKKRFEDDVIDALLKSAWWDKPIGWIMDNSALFVTVDEFISKLL